MGEGTVWGKGQVGEGTDGKGAGVRGGVVEEKRILREDSHAMDNVSPSLLG